LLIPSQRHGKARQKGKKGVKKATNSERPRHLFHRKGRKKERGEPERERIRTLSRAGARDQIQKQKKKKKQKKGN